MEICYTRLRNEITHRDVDHEAFALQLGTNTIFEKDKVEKTCTTLDYADEETKESVLTGKNLIHKAYAEVQEKKKIEKESKSS